jgi:hypothetical protein
MYIRNSYQPASSLISICKSNQLQNCSNLNICFVTSLTVSVFGRTSTEGKQLPRGQDRLVRREDGSAESHWR